MSFTLTGQSKVFQATESAFPQLVLDLKNQVSRTQAGTMRTIKRDTPDYTINLSPQITTLQQRQDLTDFVDANMGRVFTYINEEHNETWSVRLISEPTTITVQDRSLNTVGLTLQGNRV